MLNGYHFFLQDLIENNGETSYQIYKYLSIEIVDRETKLSKVKQSLYDI